METAEATDNGTATRFWRTPVGFAATFILLYLISVGLGAYRIQSRPAGEYNWDAYTLRGLLSFMQSPSRAVLKLNEGLMTSSGDSAVVVGPAWLAFKMFGESFTSLRLAMLLIAALAVPLTWLFGRMLFSNTVGLCAALMVATSQAFLLYARTGTIVGISIAPAVVGYILLWKTISPGSRRWWWWLLSLQIGLIANSYFYSPIRFLWPIAIALLTAELVLRRGSRTRFLISLVVTAAALPIALVFLTHAPHHSPVSAVKAYYNGRGEQIFRIDDSPDAIVTFIPTQTDAQRAALEQESTNTLVVKFIRKNAKDLMNLLLDRHTRPAITDFANPHGRLYARWLAPLFLAAMLLLVWSFFKSPKSRLLLALFWGYTLPMLLTSNVHIGRLVFAIPLLAVLVAMPMEPIARLISTLPRTGNRIPFQNWTRAALAIAVVLLAAVPSLRDWTQTAFPKQRGDFVAEQVETAMTKNPATQLAYVFGDVNGWDLESLRISVLRMELKGKVSFVDVTTGESLGSGAVPLLYHGLLTALEDPSSVPGYCSNIYIVETDRAQQFADETNARAIATCGRPLKSVILQG